MSAPRQRRNGLLLPLALTAGAAAASFALYYFLSDNSSSTQSTGTPAAHESESELGPRRRSPPPTTKKSIVVVVREGSSASELLSSLPSPLPHDRANIFTLIYSPSMTTHPLSDSSGGEELQGKVYRQARKLYPREAPRELVLPYTDSASLVPMLKQLAAEGVYIEGDLVGEKGAVVKAVMEWVGGVVVAVRDPATGQRIADQVGRVKGVKVLDVGRVGEDWVRRV
ncbi:hypothetical protein FN846DRAFT_980508 [Sphaerosporella brunnea]|uniref:Uncharacterized protein n=1 Tax=Sphaerosporella brunnea TaxID=1250544 RepID=A0A5J5EDL2_9PEZI|nr:hypothetical protein FN846DRAFT_980508 [Sphaerosporella brunnea]